MATFLLSCFTSAIINLVVRSGGSTARGDYLGGLRLLKRQAVLIVLVVLLGLIQHAAICGNYESAGLWGGLAISELVIVFSQYSADS